MAVCMIGKVVLLGRGLVALRRIDQRAALRRAVGIEPGSKPRNARRLGRIAIRKLDEIGLFLDLGGRRRLRCGIRRSARRDRKSTRLNSSPNAYLVCRLLLVTKKQLI